MVATKKKDDKEVKKTKPNKVAAKKTDKPKTEPKTVSEVVKPKAPTTARQTLMTIGIALAMLVWVGVSLYISERIMLFIFQNTLSTAMLMQPVWSTVYSASVYILCLALVIIVPWKLFKMKTNRDELGLTGLPTWTDILLSPVGFFVYLILSALVVSLCSAILPGVNWAQAQDVGYQNLVGAGDRILAFVALVVIAPIAEEIIFRGWLYGKIRSKIPAWLSIILVSVLFGIMHRQWNVGVNVFCMSVVMCLMREITGTIWSGTLLHIIKNGVAFYLLFISPIV